MHVALPARPRPVGLRGRKISLVAARVGSAAREDQDDGTCHHPDHIRVLGWGGMGQDGMTA